MDVQSPMVSAASGHLPLAGLKVLELGHIVAGPLAGEILADLGADVIKVEAIEGGDMARQMPGASAAMFAQLNRNKRSIALDLKGGGRDVFLSIVRSVDVVIDNFSFGVAERLGLGYDLVSAINPRLIWLSIKGFLPGPYQAQPMLDELAQMAGGLAYMTGTEDKPMRAGASVIDIGAATYGIVAVLAALRQRDQGDGRGQYIVAGLYETSAYLVGQWMAVAQCGGGRSVPMSKVQQGTRMGFGIYQLFDLGDGERVFIGMTSNAHWRRFCEEFGLLEILADERLRDIKSHDLHREELTAVIGAVLGRMTTDEVMAKLVEASVPCAPVRRPDQLGDEKQLIESGQLIETPLPDGSLGRLPKLPIRSSAYEMTLLRPPPALGGDTADVLAENGFEASEIEALVERGAVRLATAR